MQDSESFWADIKACEEKLAANPDSFCFARLAEIYLTVGLGDDALHTAQAGVIRHPGYLAGQRIMARVASAKGMLEEERRALEQITGAVPEDLDAQKRLGRLYAGNGDIDGALRVFRTALDFAPGDDEIRLELGALEHRYVAAVPGSADGHEDEEIIEDLELLDELEPFEDEQHDQGELQDDSPVVPPATTAHDPLTTSTLAELYLSQGFSDKALAIYRTLAAADPANHVVASRLAELERGSAPLDQEQGDTSPEDADVSPLAPEWGAAPGSIDEPTGVSAPAREPDAGLEIELPAEPPVFDAAPCTFAGIPEAKSEAAPVVPPVGTADNAVETLEGWLENIRRIRSCRYGKH